MSSDITNLRACKEAAEKLTTAVQKNLDIQGRNAQKTSAANAAWAVWNTKRNQRIADQTTWDKRYRETFDSKNNDEKGVRNRSCSNFPPSWCRDDYGDGWEHKRNDTDGWNCGYVICKKTHNQKHIETIDTIGDKPGNFNEVEPKDNQGEFQHEGYVPLETSITCCANVQNIIASQVSGSSLQQANDCIKGVSDQIAKAEGEKTKEVEKETEKNMQGSASDKVLEARVKAQMFSDLTSAYSENKDFANKLIIGIFIALLFCSVISSMLTGVIII